MEGLMMYYFRSDCILLCISQVCINNFNSLISFEKQTTLQNWAFVAAFRFYHLVFVKQHVSRFHGFQRWTVPHFSFGKHQSITYEIVIGSVVSWVVVWCEPQHILDFRKYKNIMMVINVSSGYHQSIIYDKVVGVPGPAGRSARPRGSECPAPRVGLAGGKVGLHILYNNDNILYNNDNIW